MRYKPPGSMRLAERCTRTERQSRNRSQSSRLARLLVLVGGRLGLVRVRVRVRVGVGVRVRDRVS